MLLYLWEKKANHDKVILADLFTDAVRLRTIDFHFTRIRNKDMSNRFDIYSSKVKRVNIPIPRFIFFHKASSEEEVDPKFIGREQISDKLYSWLKDDPKGGSYLVTGFRGMGKSSFVGRVLNQLTQRTKPYEYFTGFVFFLSIITLFFFAEYRILLLFPCLDYVRQDYA